MSSSGAVSAESQTAALESKNGPEVRKWTRQNILPHIARIWTNIGATEVLFVPTGPKPAVWSRSRESASSYEAVLVAPTLVEERGLGHDIRRIFGRPCVRTLGPFFRQRSPYVVKLFVVSSTGDLHKVGSSVSGKRARSLRAVSPERVQPPRYRSWTPLDVAGTSRCDAAGPRASHVGRTWPRPPNLAPPHQHVLVAPVSSGPTRSQHSGQPWPNSGRIQPSGPNPTNFRRIRPDLARIWPNLCDVDGLKPHSGESRSVLRFLLERLMTDVAAEPVSIARRRS